MADCLAWLANWLTAWMADCFLIVSAEVNSDRRGLAVRLTASATSYTVTASFSPALAPEYQSLL